MDTTLVGLIALAAPLLIAGVLFLRRNMPVFLFFIALCAVGLGYLATTGAAGDIGALVLEKAGMLTAEKAAEPVPAN